MLNPEQFGIPDWKLQGYSGPEEDEFDEGIAAVTAAGMLGPGAEIRRMPSKEGLRPTRKRTVDLQRGDMHDFGRVSHWEPDPYIFAEGEYGKKAGEIGRHGWVVFEGGSRTSEGERTTVWVPKTPRTN